MRGSGSPANGWNSTASALAYGYQSCCCAQDEAILAADPASVEEARSLLAEAPELAETQGVPMLGLRIAASEARLDQRLGAWGEVARRLDLALRRMVEKLRLRRSPRCARTSRTDPAEDESGDLARFHPIGVGAAIGRWKGWRLLLGAYVSYWHESESERGAKPVRLCPCSSDVNLFSYEEGIIDLNAEIPDGALDLGMSQQQLNGT